MEVKSDDDRILSEEPEAMRPVCRYMFTPEAGDESGERAKITDSGSFPAAGTKVKTENHASSPYYADGEPLSLLTALAGGAMAFIAGAGEGGARARTVLESGQPSRRKGAPGATPTTPITPSASQPAFCAPAANDHRVLASSPFSALASAVLGPLGIGLSRYKSPQDPKEVDANNGVAGARGKCQRGGKRIRLDPSPWVKSSPAWIVADHAVKAGQDLTRKGRFVMLPRSLQRRSWDAVFIFVQVIYVVLLLVREWWRHTHDGWLYQDLEWPHAEGLYVVQCLIDLLVILDIVINLRTAYIDQRGRMVKCPYQIARKYAASGWLFVDVLCALPLDVVLREPETVRRVEMQATVLGRLLRRTKLLQGIRGLSTLAPIRAVRRVGRLAVNTRRVVWYMGGLRVAFSSISAAIKVVSPRWAVSVIRSMRAAGLFSAMGASGRFLRFIRSGGAGTRWLAQALVVLVRGAAYKFKTRVVMPVAHALTPRWGSAQLPEVFSPGDCTVSPGAGDVVWDGSKSRLVANVKREALFSSPGVGDS